MIKEFKNEYRFLSNFYPSLFEHEKITYPTVEHFFQAQKTTDITKKTKIATSLTPGIAKRRGRQLLLRKDWKEIKDQTMMLGLMYKFLKHPQLAEKLKQTAGEYLEEGNTWGDKYWGVDLSSKEGKNTLGKMLMAIRSLLNKGELLPTF